ncbi:MAG: 50S ribosomal protein L11 methyltransferase, partial [Deltaproteobacteria bacterium]|nr:50S ribosomal protein L11 methyltransferase [Deltaproteobacteria bacterium]
PKEELSRHWREIGVGSGVLSILAAKEGWADSILATDIEPDAVLVARLNLWLHSTDETGKKIPGRQPIDIVEVGSATDLYDGDALKTGFTFGNLPVIPAFDPSLIQRGSYYLAEGIPEDLFGFGLIARLLTEGEGNRGTHFLTVPGWGGKEIVDNMASARNYRASIEHQVRVPWPKGAAVSVFASMEKVAEERGGDFRFRFYSGGIGIDAREVLRRERERLGRIIYSDPKEAPATNSDPRYQIEHDLWITQFTPTSGGLTASAPTITASARHEAPQSAKRFKRLVSLASAPFRFVARHARIAALGRVFRAGR